MWTALAALTLLGGDEPFRPDPAWTPPPKEGNVAAWQKTTDKDWIDPRFRQMDTGPFLNATVRFQVGDKAETTYRGTAIKVGVDNHGAMLFDRNSLQMRCAWTGWLHHKDTRFGLLNTPTPDKSVELEFPRRFCWKKSADPTTEAANKHPLPAADGRFEGIYLDGDRTWLRYAIGRDLRISEQPWMVEAGGNRVFLRRLKVAARGTWEFCCAKAAAGGSWRIDQGDSHRLVASSANQTVAIALEHAIGVLKPEGGELWLEASPGDPNRETEAFISYVTGDRQGAGLPTDLAEAIENERLGRDKAERPKHPKIVTRGTQGRSDGPLAVDTLTIPFDNPYKALFFCTGLDFLDDGRIAVCTAHGDVWLVRATENLERVEWRRFASGLYQPLGLKIVGNVIHVIERGQITRVLDSTGDDLADAYENFADQWYSGGGEHSFDTRLETDPEGAFYFFKTGDTDTPTGGCLLKVSRDGRTCETFATGFRHPIGMGMSPNGQATGSDQQGNWMPASKIDVYRQGGFYGDMRAHHRRTAPTVYDPPLMWIPHEIDNSSGGQVWVPEGLWGPLSGRMLHFSWGQCRAFLTFRQEPKERRRTDTGNSTDVEPPPQGGLTDLGIHFESGPIGGRFHPKDHCLYVSGLRGWQTAAEKDGCLQRVRYTGTGFRIPLNVKATVSGLELTFSQPLDSAVAQTAANYRVHVWNYHWSEKYGSKRYSTADPNRPGEDELKVASASLSSDGRTVSLGIWGMRPAMQMQVEYQIADVQRKPLSGAIYNTVHWLEDR